jgi:hypothetical protein
MNLLSESFRHSNVQGTVHDIVSDVNSYLIYLFLFLAQNMRLSTFYVAKSHLIFIKM